MTLAPLQLQVTTDARRQRRREELMAGFARNLLANLSHPRLWGGKLLRDKDGSVYNPNGITLARHPNALNQFTLRESSYLYGMVSVLPGLDAPRMLDVLSAKDSAQVVALLPEDWRMPKVTPTVEIDQQRRCLTLRIPWPDGTDGGENLVQDTLLLEEVHPTVQPHLWKNGRIILGADAWGTITSIEFAPTWDSPASTQNMILAGQQRTGKSALSRLIAAQLALGNIADVVYIDGKYAEGIGQMDGTANQIGPLATDLPATRNALGWLVTEMARRYEEMRRQHTTGHTYRPIVWFFSEFGKYRDDAVTMFMVWQLLSQGPAANLHAVMDTQTPNAAVFGRYPEARFQFDRVVFFRMANQYDGAALLPPGLHLDSWTLTKRGDGHQITRSEAPTRLLFAYFRDARIAEVTGHAPRLAQWPAVDVAALEGLTGFGDIPLPGTVDQPWTPQQIALAKHVLDYTLKGDKREILRGLLRQYTGSGMTNTAIKKLFDFVDEVSLAMTRVETDAAPHWITQENTHEN